MAEIELLRAQLRRAEMIIWAMAWSAGGQIKLPNEALEDFCLDAWLTYLYDPAYPGYTIRATLKKASGAQLDGCEHKERPNA